MRVAHVITRLIVGGAQENTLASVLGLRAKPGVAVSLISGPTTGPEGSLEPRVAQIPGIRPHPTRAKRILRSVIGVANLCMKGKYRESDAARAA